MWPRATEGRSSDRWRGRCSVCARDARSALFAQSARQGKGASVAARDARRRRRRAAKCSVRGEAAGRAVEGAAGDGARDQPTPGRRFERRLRHACTGAAGRSVVGRGGAGRGPGARRRPRRRLSARRGAPLSGPRVQASGTMSKPQVVHSTTVVGTAFCDQQHSSRGMHGACSASLGLGALRWEPRGGTG